MTDGARLTTITDAGTWNPECGHFVTPFGAIAQQENRHGLHRPLGTDDTR
jgi:hypothetical protein